MNVTYVFLLFSFLLTNLSLVAPNNPDGLDGKVFYIINAANGNVLSADFNNKYPNNVTVLAESKGENRVFNQHWKFVATGKGEKLYYIINQGTNVGDHNYLEVNPHPTGNNKGKVQLREYNGNSINTYRLNQVWYINQQQDEEYSIISKVNGAYALSIDKDELQKNRSKVVISYNQGNSDYLYWILTEVK